MRIFYVPGDYPFCYYYRGYLPGVYSEQPTVGDFVRGVDVAPETYTAQALKADVVVFQRPTSLPSLELAKLLKRKGKYVIFDNDDTYAGIPLNRLGNEKRVELAKQLNSNLNEFLKLADGATVSTEHLKEEYGKVNQNIVVLKNCIDPLDALPARKNTTGKFRVGIIGSVTSNDDYVHIKDDLRRLSACEDITLVILGAGKYPDGTFMEAMKEDQDFWNSLNVEWHPQCSVSEYYSKVANLAIDVAIVPRKEHYFNQCKSNLKFLDMSLLKIPVIAQGFSDGTSPYQGADEPYMTVIRDGWYEAVIDCKENYPRYKSLAEKAHEYVLHNYNIATYASEWQKQIEYLCRYQKNS